MEKNKKHNIEIVVDRLVVREGIEKRLTDSIENVLHLTGGLLMVDVIGGEPMMLSEGFACPTAVSASTRSSREVFPSTTPSAPARSVSAWDSRWSLTRI